MMGFEVDIVMQVVLWIRSWPENPKGIVRGCGAAVGAVCVLRFAIYLAYLPHRLAAIWRAELHSSVLSR